MSRPPAIFALALTTLTAIAACGAPEPKPAEPPPPPPPAPSAPPSLVPAEAPSAAPTALPKAEPLPQAPFPPPAAAPMHERTAAPGDGVWTPLLSGQDDKRMVKTTLHPHPIKGHVYATIVAIDRYAAEVALVAGTDEPPAPHVPKERRPGLVPKAHLNDLLVVHNGGFMAKHGGWGMKIGEDQLLPPVDDACTVALYNDGSIKVRTYRALTQDKQDKDAPSLVAYRQTPPCLVESSAIHEALLGPEKPKRWGSSETGTMDVRRSALGVDATGRTVFFALGEWIEPRQLAEVMKAIGAVNAAELDINWSYTRFLLYGPSPEGPSAPPDVTATLIPKIKHAKGEYVKKPAYRDFFYWRRRAPR